MYVDAHQHFWRLSRGDYRWLTSALGAIHRDFEPRELAPLLARWGIARTVLVQAADTEAETLFLLTLAHATEFVTGVVGWTDFEARDVVARIEALSHDPKLLGMRPMLQDIDDERWVLRAELEPAFRALVGHGLVFDALVKPVHLPHLRELSSRHPDLRVVIDHGAKPRIPRSDEAWTGFRRWRDDMRALARDTSATVKLSGLVTEASGNWTPDDLRPFVDVLLESFGPSRMMWGSDWPVVEVAGGYDRWRECALGLLSALDVRQREDVLGGTAARVYGIVEHGASSSSTTPTARKTPRQA